MEPALCSDPEFSWALPRPWAVTADEAEGPVNRPLSLLLPSKALLCYFVLFPARCQLSSASFFSPRFALLHSSGNQKQKKRKENRLDEGGGRRGSLPPVTLSAALPATRYGHAVASHVTSACAHVHGHVTRCPAMPGCGMEGRGKGWVCSPTLLAAETGGCRRERGSSPLPTCRPKPSALPTRACWGQSVPRLCACRLLRFSLCSKIWAFRAGRGLGAAVVIGAPYRSGTGSQNS